MALLSQAQNTQLDKYCTITTCWTKITISPISCQNLKTYRHTFPVLYASLLHRSIKNKDNLEKEYMVSVLRFCMVLYDFLWLWLSMFMFGPLLAFRFQYVFLRAFYFIYGLHGLLWSCMDLHGNSQFFRPTMLIYGQI